MIGFIPALALAFCAGLLVKTVDWIDDERKGKNVLKWPLAILYGIILGYLISQSSFSTVFLGALFAQVFARKIDTHTHVVGFALAMLSVFVLGFPGFDAALFIYFTMLAFLDEMEFVGKLKPLSDYRPFLPVGSALLILFGGFDYFLGIILFDIGYALASALQTRVFKVK